MILVLYVNAVGRAFAVTVRLLTESESVHRSCFSLDLSEELEFEKENKIILYAVRYRYSYPN